VRHFSLQYTKYSREKMASSGGKSFAVGHISGFQIDLISSRQFFDISPYFLILPLGETRVF